MKMRTRLSHTILALAAALSCAGALSSGSAAAQSLSDEWRFRAFIYLWGSQINGTAKFPGGNTANFDMSFGTILAGITFLALASGVFLGLYRMAKGWEGETPEH